MHFISNIEQINFKSLKWLKISKGMKTQNKETCSDSKNIDLNCITN